jgi:hypothetical protein
MLSMSLQIFTADHMRTNFSLLLRNTLPICTVYLECWRMLCVRQQFVTVCSQCTLSISHRVLTAC